LQEAVKRGKRGRESERLKVRKRSFGRDEPIIARKKGKEKAMWRK